MQFHTGTQAGKGGRRAAVFHGQGAGGDEDERKREIAQFLKMVDQGLRETVHEHHQRFLVLAGVDYLVSLFRHESQYGELLPEAIPGSPDARSAEALHAAAWPLAESHLLEARRRAAERFAQRVGTGLASSDLEEVTLAAHGGRVETLFVSLQEQRWGRVDPASRSVEVHEAPEPGDCDLLEEAALCTLPRDGTVHAVTAEEIPADTPVAAVFRD